MLEVRGGKGGVGEEYLVAFAFELEFGCHFAEFGDALFGEESG